jgi:hypothetical protein
MKEQILFEHSPAFILVCITVGLGYAWILYRARQSWSRSANRFLFAMRAIVVSFLTFLLLGPILKLTHNLIERPSFVFILDDSQSVGETLDSLKLKKTESELDKIHDALARSGLDAAVVNLSGTDKGFDKNQGRSSDVSAAIHRVLNDFEGKNLAGMVLVSDGIYNGTSPLYSAIRLPIYTVGLGDTTQRVDLVLKSLDYNKIAYQGNIFPLRATVLVLGTDHREVTVHVTREGKEISRQTRNSGTSSLLDFEFLVDATEKGLQRIDVVVESLSGETNIRNNRASAFVDVAKGIKKILVIAPAPHPDIKAFRSVIEKNPNYEFVLHIPGVKEADPAMLQPGKADLILFHQVADNFAKTNFLFSKLSKGSTSILVVIGAGSNLRQLSALGLPFAFDNTGQRDEATPVLNASFRDFGFSENVASSFAKFPPISVPFGRFRYPPQSLMLISQQIGSVSTDRPMVLTYDEGQRKTGVIIGEGFWRWRLGEFEERGNSEGFDEVFSKLIQYLSTEEDKRKFRCFPIQNEFSDAEAVVFEGQVYNDLLKQVYGNRVDLEIIDEKHKSMPFNYILSPGNNRYQIGGLNEGVYHYKASTEIEGARQEVAGEFLVKAQNMESQNLTADFGLLRKLSHQTGGRFYNAASLAALGQDLQKHDFKNRIHSEEAFDPLINSKWAFFVLLLLITTEWSLRKYLGAY